MTPRVLVWEDSVGFLPWKVTVYEEPKRNSILYLRWRQDGNWKCESLRRRLRTPRGAIDPVQREWAKKQAEAKYAQLVAGVAAAQQPKPALTLQQGLAAAIEPSTGKYPTDTLHRRNVVREMERAMEAWGADTSWEEIKKADLRKLWRHRILEIRSDLDPVTKRPKTDGLRGAEVTIQRVLAVASWLRDEEKIPAGACVAGKRWKVELRTDWLELSGERAIVEPKRPRHKLEEMRRILGKAREVDPRFELVMALGAELRLGQVLRCRRSDLNLEHATLTVRGRGQKRGTIVHLTEGQMAVARRALTEGYLRELERELADFALFPAGQMPGGRKGEGVATVARHGTAAPVDRSVLDNWFHAAEDLAEVPRVKGRAAYGVRRAAVDAVKAAKISREGLQAHGGWSDTQMPDMIYADQQMDYARDEARDARAVIRGETVPTPVQETADAGHDDAE